MGTEDGLRIIWFGTGKDISYSFVGFVVWSKIAKIWKTAPFLKSATLSGLVEILRIRNDTKEEKKTRKLIIIA